MKRRAVSSSLIASIGYDRRAHTLEVEFVNGGVWRYHQIQLSIFARLMKAQSKGGFFNANIRDQYTALDCTPSLPVEGRRQSLIQQLHASLKGGR